MPQETTALMEHKQVRKVLGVPLQKELTKNKDGTLLVRGYFTSDNKDEVGDIITRKATEVALPKYREWGNIRYMHMPRPVGKVVSIGEEDGLEWNEVEIKVVDPQAVFEVEQGLLVALSVGILINWEDIDFLEDGGWVINAYTLAEISLVDHPANYDARLKELNVDQGLRQMVREYGMDAVAVTMTHLVERELKEMPEETISNEEVIEEEKDLEVPAEVEAEVEEKAEPVEEEKDLEAEPAEEPVAEEVIEEDKAIEPEAIEEPVVEDDVAEDVEAEKTLDTEDATDEPEVEVLPEPWYEVLEEVKALRIEVKELRQQLEITEDAPQAEGHEADVADDKAMTLSEAKDTEEPGVPAERKGAIPETNMPEEPAVEDEPTAKETSALQGALTKYFRATGRL